LAVWDPHGLVVVCRRHLVKWYEGRPWHSVHGVEHTWVVHTGLPSRRHELLQALVTVRQIILRRHSSILA
jgi:hypothetical protein